MAGFPIDLARKLAHFRNGLVLLSGVAGAGKSTTLAMIIQLLNEEGGYRIITIEDPVEYVFPQIHDSVITQREVGRDVKTFADGLKYGLRQDPDIFLVGEIRDRATAQLAVSPARQGISSFPRCTLGTRKEPYRDSPISFLNVPPSSRRVPSPPSLRAVVCQHLLPGVVEGEKRELALEILFNSCAGRQQHPHGPIREYRQYAPDRSIGGDGAAGRIHPTAHGGRPDLSGCGRTIRRRCHRSEKGDDGWWVEGWVVGGCGAATSQ